MIVRVTLKSTKVQRCGMFVYPRHESLKYASSSVAVDFLLSLPDVIQVTCKK